MFKIHHFETKGSCLVEPPPPFHVKKPYSPVQITIERIVSIFESNLAHSETYQVRIQ